MHTSCRRCLKIVASISLGSIALMGLAATAPVLSPAPIFPPGQTVDTLHGVQVADPYRALEDGDDLKVQAWSNAQNARARAYLNALPGRAAVAEKLRRLYTTISPYYIGLQARGPHIFAMYMDRSQQQQSSLVRLNAAADPASRVTVIDPNALDASGHTAIDWYVASPDGSKVAVSLSQNGSEDGTLHVYDIATGKQIDAPISQVQYATAGGSLAWTADGRGFWYTRYPTSGPDEERHFNQQVWFHRLGTDTAKDSLALGTKDGLPRTAEVFLSNASAATVALASVQLGDGGQWQHFILKPDAPAMQIATYADQLIAAVLAHDGTVYGLSRLNASMGKVLKLSPPYEGGFAKAPVFVPERSDAAIINGGEFSVPLIMVGDNLFVSRVAGGPSQVSVYDAQGRGTDLSIPPISSVYEIAPLPNGEALYLTTSYLEPLRYLRWDAKTGQSRPTALTMTLPISYADVEVKRVFATSRDGTQIPLNIIAKKGVKLDGSHPVILDGYGGYGVNQVPVVSGGGTRLWLDAGGIRVVANIRGGGEYGETWHQQGMLLKKQNVFDDFAAAGEWLIQNGYTSHDKLALRGGSNGGLLMGAQITQHPGLARAVVSSVGIYDMVRFELDPNGSFNTTEFGSVKDPAQFQALYAYSPYHRVKAGTAYPAVLMQTGANDGRVNPMHSRKFTAALQAATVSDRPILLRTSDTAGHGIGSSMDELLDNAVDELMFLLDQLGMSPADAAR
jgi:prolyl oligopeptidase